MKYVKYAKSFLLSITVLVLFSGASMAARLSDLSHLKDVKVNSIDNSTAITLEFRGYKREENITYNKDYIQIVFPNTYITPSKLWIDVKDGITKQIFAYQFNSTTVRVRIYTHDNAENLKDRISFIRNNNNMIIRYSMGMSGKPENSTGQGKGISELQIPSIDKDDVTIFNTVTPDNDTETPQQKEDKNPEPGNIQEDYRKILMSTPAPVTAVSSSEVLSPEESPGLTQDNIVPDKKVSSPDLFSSFVKMFAVVGILLSILIAGLYAFKKIAQKKNGIKGDGSNIRIITRTYLGPKKSIALIDIGGERIVVGITSNHISPLAKLGRNGQFSTLLNEEILGEEKIELSDELWEKV